MESSNTQMTGVRYRVTATSLNLREGPGESQKIKGSVKTNDIVEALTTNADGTWLEVRREDDGLTGWAFSQYLEEIKTFAPPSSKKAGFEIPPIRYDVPEPTTYTGSHIVRLELPLEYFSKQLAPDYALNFPNEPLGNRVIELNFDGDVFSKGLTMEVWLKRTAPVYGEICLGLRLNADGTLFYMYGTTIKSDALIINRWYHIALSMDPVRKLVTLYVDGKSIGTTNQDLNLTLKSFEFGYWGEHTSLTGQVDELRLWNVVRTDQEISDHIARNVTGQSGLFCHWRFDNGTGDIAVDASGNGHDGKIVGAQWIISDRPLTGGGESLDVKRDQETLTTIYGRAQKGDFDPNYFHNINWISSDAERSMAVNALPTQEVFVQNLKDGKLLSFYRVIGERIASTFINPDLGDFLPAIYLIERYRLSSYPGAYGAGKTIGTYSLLPGEKTKIYFSSYQSSSDTRTSASSILDSYTEDSADAFESTLNTERASNTTNKTSSSSNKNQSIKADVSGSLDAKWGFGSAKLESKLSTSMDTSRNSSTDASREELSKDISNSLTRHAAAASSKRDVNISNSDEHKEDSGTSTSTEREIENFNRSCTLNFIFRQMNQEFYTLLHLIDVRICATGYDPVALSNMDQLLETCLVEQYRNPVREFIESELNTIRDLNGDVQPNFIKKHTLASSSDGTAQTYLGVNRQFTSTYIDPVTKHEIEVPGVIVNVDKIVMRTDGIMVESVLGQGPALDDNELRKLKAEADILELNNQIKAMQLKILQDGDKVRADLYARLFSAPNSAP